MSKAQNGNSKCDLCGKSFVTLSNFQKHVSKVHEITKPLAYEQTFRKKDSLKKHIRNAYEERKDFK